METGALLGFSSRWLWSATLSAAISETRVPAAAKERRTPLSGACTLNIPNEGYDDDEG